MNEEGPRIYDRNLMHHYQSPHNRGELDNPDAEASAENPNCGDRINMQVNLKDDTLWEVKFEGDGCVLCIGSASILTQLARGLTVCEAESLGLEDLMKNIDNSKRKREECITVSLDALQRALSRLREE